MTVLMTRKRQAPVAGAALIALAALAGTATAQVTAEQQSAIRANCRSDFMSKCSGVTPGGKDALLCLQKNVASLSPGCKTAVSATIPATAPAKPAEAKPAQAAPAPAPAAATPAADPAAALPAPASAPPVIVQAPPPPAVKPSQSQRPVIAPQQAVAAPPVVATPPAVVAPPAATAPESDAASGPTEQQMRAIRFTCRHEFANNCRGVPPGGAEAIACLQRNPGKLTPDCKTSLAALGDAMPPAVGPLPPAAARTPNAPVAMTAVIGRACARDLLLHCRDIDVGDGRKIACLMERGPALAPLCKAALNITEPVR